MEALYSQLCATKNNSSRNASKLKPMEVHVFEGKWIVRPSKPHPALTEQLSPLPQDQPELGHPLRASNPSSVSILMVADSGCQSSIIPHRSALAMGINKMDITPVTLSMRGAIEEDLGVQGAIIVEVAVVDSSNVNKTTKQMLYVSSKIGKVFLCREALVALGVIHPDFPSVPTQWPTDTLSSVADEETTPCSCPKHGQKPLPTPNELPSGMTATADDLPALKQLLLDYYGATAFNT